MSEAARGESGNDRRNRQRQPQDNPASQPGPNDRARWASEAIESLERTVRRFESVVGARQGGARDEPAPSEAKAPDEFLAGLERTLAQLSAEARRLADAADRLERLVGEFAPAPPVARSERQEAMEPADEPRFWVNDQPLEVVVGNVHGFQALMELQRRMSEIAGVEGASVVGYKNAQATLELVLDRPLSARDIMAGIGEIEGQVAATEESGPEERRLRLRFIDPAEEMSRGGSLRVEFRSSPSR